MDIRLWTYILHDWSSLKLALPGVGGGWSTFFAQRTLQGHASYKIPTPPPPGPVLRQSAVDHKQLPDVCWIPGKDRTPQQTTQFQGGASSSTSCSNSVSPSSMLRLLSSIAYTISAKTKRTRTQELSCMLRAQLNKNWYLREWVWNRWLTLQRVFSAPIINKHDNLQIVLFLEEQTSKKVEADEKRSRRACFQGALHYVVENILVPGEGGLVRYTVCKLGDFHSFFCVFCVMDFIMTIMTK